MWLYFALLAVSMVMLLVSSFSDGRWTTGMQFGAEIAMSALTVAWCIANRQEVLPLLRKSAPPQYFLLAAGGAVVTYAMASGITAVLVKYAGLRTLSYREPFDEANLGMGWQVLSICVQPAVFEELAFRGVLFGALARVLGNSEALLVSALMFAILHLSMPSLPHLFVLGLALGWLRIRTGSLFPCVLLHFTHNLLVVISEQFGRWLPW